MGTSKARAVGGKARDSIVKSQDLRVWCLIAAFISCKSIGDVTVLSPRARMRVYGL